MRRAVDADIPVLGLCFGGQMLARVLGGEVFRGERAEIGWLPVRSTDPELVPEGPWFQWHFDSFTVAARRDRDRRIRRRPAGVRCRPEPRPAVPPRGDDRRSWTTGSGRIGTSWTETASIPTTCSRRRSVARTRAAGTRGSSSSATCATSPVSRGPERRPGSTGAPADGDDEADEGHGDRDPIRRNPRLPAVPGSRRPEHRARRRSLADHHRRTQDPGRVLRRRHGLLPRFGRPGDRRGGSRAGRPALVLLQPPLHERAAGAPGGSPDRGRGAGHGPGPAGVGRVRGERDRVAARSALPRRARRHRAVAGDLAGAVLPRVHDGNAGAHRPARAPRAVHAVPRVPPPHPTLHMAHRPHRRSGACRSSTGVLEEAGPETVAAFFCEPVSAAALPGDSPPDRVLGRPGGTPRASTGS